jgi:hypothetical protein
MRSLGANVHRCHRREQPGGTDVSAPNDGPSNIDESATVCFTAFEIPNDEGQVAVFAPQLHDELRAFWRRGIARCAGRLTAQATL